MAFVVNDRVKETTATTGTGTVTLDGASTGYQTFAAGIGNGNTTFYAIVLGSEWETGIGTVGSGTLSRDTVLQSSNSDTKVNFSAGSKEVFVTYPADRSVYVDGSTVITSGIGSNQGDILYSSGTNTFSLLAKDANSTRYLANTGTNNNPSWSQINLTNGVTGTLPVANGGTGETSYVNGQLLIGNSTGNTLTKATLTAGSGISITNGAGSITITATGGGGGGGGGSGSDIFLNNLFGGF